MSSATGYVIVALLAVVTSVLCSTSLEYAGHRCVEEELDITCPPQHIIAIHSAVWGRDDQETCYVAGSSSVTSCAADVTSYVNSICDGQLACDFVVDPDEFDADPCPGTSKYLKINYACEKPMYSGLWCEDNTMRLSCMASDIIHIEDAFFGRDNAITCSGDRDVTDTECTSASVHDVISTHCNNKNSCVLNVNNVTLGEPCLGTYKYLNINFTCSECKNARGSQCDGWSDSGECDANSDWMTAYCRKSCWECDAIESCPDTADDCERLAQRGYCQIDPDFVPGCQYSCNQCIDTYVPPETPGGLPGRACINLEDFEDCNYWADVGECAKNPVWMHERCFQSCGCQLPDWLHEELACEGDTISLNCTSEGPNSRIYSWDAWFGRLNHDTCPSNRSNSLADTDCEGRPEPHDYTKDTCDGEPACDVTADADVLGDECRAGTHKYYVVYYSCRECENTYGDDADCDRWASWGECEDNTYWMYQNCFRSCSGCVPTGETLPTTQVSTESTISVGTADDHVVTTSHTTEQSTFDAVSTTRSRDSTTQTTVTVPVSNTTLVGCSGEEVSMSCPTGTIIIIKAAFYGRRDEDDMCTDDQSSVIECDVEHILDKINSYCDFSRRQHCTFVIGREITDSNVCERGSNPYMEIDYSCMSEDLAAEQCSRTCINGGLCVGPNECVCATGYTGSICHDHTCTEVSDCSRRGRCVGANRCYCNSGWGGPRCDEAICIERNDCSGHGQCVGPNQCWCYPFFSGSDCADCTPSFPHAGPGCLKCPPCSEHGTCIHETNVEVPPTYIGCFVDDGDEPLMPYREWSGLPTTIMLCMDKCNSHAYQYAGLKYGDECYCTNSIAGYETSDMCDQRCTHSSAARYEKCGGVNSTSVYKAYEGRCECQINWAGQLCDRCSDHFMGDSCTECAEGYSGRLCDISTHTTETTLNPSTHQTTAQTTQTTQQSTHTSMLSTTTREHTTSDAHADTTAQSTTHTTRTTQTVVHTEPSDTTPPTMSQSTSEQFNQSDGSTTITSHDNLITTDDGLFIAETENPKPHTNILENFILIMDSSWDDEFSYETSPATQMFLTSVGHLLGSLYSSMLEDYITLNITSLRNHSSLVEVSHNLIFNISMAPDALIMHHCAILEHLHEQDGHVTDDDDVNVQSLDIVMDDQMTDRVYVCQNLEDYCTNDGVMTRNITSSKLYCDCRSDSSGDRCDVTETSQFIMVVVAAAAVGFPLLIVLFVCCLLTDKKKKRNEPKLPPRTLSLKNPNRPTMNPNRPMMNPNRPMKVSNDYVAR